MTEQAYEGFALVEQMGFHKTVGRVREVEQYGTKMLRLDVPVLGKDGRLTDEVTTRFCGGPSIYQVTPLSEALALDQLKRQGDVRPASPVDYALEDRTAHDEFDGNGEDDE